MRLQDRYFTFVINFLLGIVWGFVFIGAFGAFYSFNDSDIFSIIISVLVGILPGMIGVIIIEHIIVNKEKLSELKKQTKLLEQLLDNKINSPK